MSLSIRQIKFCAAECHRQQSGELSVGRMCDALSAIRGYRNANIHMNVAFVKILGWMIEPKNRLGFRKVPVRIKNKSISYVVPHENIADQLGKIISMIPQLKTEEETALFYKEFEEIHPFIDGNGRVGALLWNYLNNTLENPIAPPDFWA